MSEVTMIPNIEQLLTNRAKAAEATEAETELADCLNEYRVLSVLCCSEASFLAGAFGPEFLDGNVTMEQFLDAFRVDAPPSGQLG